VLTLITCHAESVELHQLRYFDAVARHRHFTRAANELRVAQPAVSAQIRRLEAELRCELFHRSTRAVRLTTAGELLLPHVRRVLDELLTATAELDGLANPPRGKVILGAIQSLDPFDLPGCLAGFHRHSPGVEVTLRSGTAEIMLAALRTDEFDLALAPVPATPPTDLAVTPLFTDELVIALPRQHPLANRTSTTLDALCDDPFVALPVGSGLRATLAETAAQAGFVPHVQFESQDPRRVRDLVSHGLGVALLPRSVVNGSPVAILRLRPRPLLRRVGLITRAGRTLPTAVEACRRFLTEWPVPGRDPEP
jgi:LysR family transcriptional regulator, transcription activator of glutamate synthase operon